MESKLGIPQSARLISTQLTKTFHSRVYFRSRRNESNEKGRVCFIAQCCGVAAGRLLEQLGNADMEGICKLDQRSETEILLAPFDRACK
jgi:hypothetical protein